MAICESDAQVCAADVYGDDIARHVAVRLSRSAILGHELHSDARLS